MQRRPATEARGFSNSRRRTRAGPLNALPLNPSKEWKKIDAETAATFYKRIGNMVLLGAKDNVTLGNGSFESKQATLQASPFTTTQEVGNCQKWDAEEIMNRQIKLAELARKVWPL